MRALFFTPLGFSLALCMASAAIAAPSGGNFLSGKQVLLIADRGGADATVDDKIAAHLIRLGARVTVADDSQETLPFTGKNLIIISSTADAQLMGGQLRDVPARVLTWNSAYLPRLGMTGRVEGRDFGITEEPDTYLSKVNQPHPMAAGLAGAADPLSRVIYLNTNSGSTAAKNQAMRGFLRFILSAEGQAVVREQGIYPPPRAGQTTAGRSDRTTLGAAQLRGEGGLGHTKNTIAIQSLALVRRMSVI